MANDDLGDPTCWTDRENAIFNAGWNDCLKFQPGEAGRLRAALTKIHDALKISAYGRNTETFKIASEALAAQQSVQGETK